MDECLPVSAVVRGSRFLCSWLCDSAVYAVHLYLSQASVLIKTAERIKLGGSRETAYLHYCREIQVSPKIRVFPSETLSQIPDLISFSTFSL